MQKKTFIFAALLIGLCALLMGQPSQANTCFLPSIRMGAVLSPAGFSPSGGATPDKFSVRPDFLPSGRNLGASGAISGTPTPEGSVVPLFPPTFIFSPTTLVDAIYGTAYTPVTLVVTGGVSPYTYSITTNNLPPGMTLSTGGTISGAPTAIGAYSFTVTAVDNSLSPGPYSGTQVYTLVVDPAPLTITGAAATMPYGGPLPGLSVNYTGFVNGDNASSLTTQPTVATTALVTSPVGPYP